MDLDTQITVIKKTSLRQLLQVMIWAISMRYSMKGLARRPLNGTVNTSCIITTNIQKSYCITVRSSNSVLVCIKCGDYGDKTEFREEREFEGPLNVYGYSKSLFDHMSERFYLKQNHQYVVSVILTCMVRVKATKVQWQAWHST